MNAREDAELLADTIGALRAGASPEQAWREAADVSLKADGSPDWKRNDPLALSITAASRLARHAGVPLAQVLGAVEATRRESAETAARHEAAMAGPRASARVLMWLPLGGVGMSALADPGVLRLLLATPLGFALLAAGAALTWAGRRWMHSLARAAELASLPP